MPSMTCPTVRIKTPAGEVTINESEFDAVTMERLDPPAPSAPLLPPPPPAPADPLADLGANWQTGDPAEMRALAAAVSGRAVENVKQAVQVISAELAKRAAK